MSGLGLFRLHPGLRNSSSSSEDEGQNRSPPGPNPHRVKRALFGPTDHEENLRFVRKELKKAKNEAASKWNFDFDNETPMEGRYSWKTVDTDEVPLPYLQSDLASLSEEERSESKENRVSASSSPPTVPEASTSETPTSSTTQQPPDPLAEPPAGSVHDLRTPAPPPPPSSSSTPAEPPSSSTSSDLGARAKDVTKERKITEAQFQFKSRKSRSKSSSKLRLKRLGGGADAASRSPSVQGRGRAPRDSEEPGAPLAQPVAPLARAPRQPTSAEHGSSSDE